MNLLIPMAGLGSRFSAAGYTDPKPLIKFLGKTMIEHVVDSFPLAIRHLIFIVQKEHVEKYDVKNFLQERYEGCDVVVIDGVTEGAACTVLQAKHLINNDEPLAIMNSDNIIKFNEASVTPLYTHADGVIMTFEDTDPKWSFAKLDKHGFVTEVVEKVPVSTHATAGLYFWYKGSQFVDAAELMIKKNIRYKNEFYVAPVYTQNVALGHKVITMPVDEMHGVGTPEDLEAYIKHETDRAPR
jgi:dTDP-glucose pyrophosphorylase